MKFGRKSDHLERNARNPRSNFQLCRLDLGNFYATPSQRLNGKRRFLLDTFYGGKCLFMRVKLSRFHRSLQLFKSLRSQTDRSDFQTFFFRRNDTSLERFFEILSRRRPRFLCLVGPRYQSSRIRNEIGTQKRREKSKIQKLFYNTVAPCFYERSRQTRCCSTKTSIPLFHLISQLRKEDLFPLEKIELGKQFPGLLAKRNKLGIKEY